MMKQFDIDKAIYEKYIVPTKHKTGYMIGIEFEIPILNMSQEKIDFSVIQKVVLALREAFDLNIEKRDDNGDIYCLSNEETGDTISFDYSYCNVEFSMGTVSNLHVAYERFKTYYQFLERELDKYHYRMTGMGVSPYGIYNDNNALPGQRYRMIQHHLESYVEHPRFKAFHSRPNFGSYSCASQVQLDVSEENLIRTINTLNRLEPIKAVLFSNSLLLDPEFNLVSARDRFWDSSMYGYNPHNVGMFEIELTDIEELVEYIKRTSLFNVARDGKYIYFTPIPAEQFFQMESVEGMVFNGDHFVPYVFHPEPSDLEYLRSYKFEDLTFRGTIEYRSACCQPVSECMCVAAFHVGLQEKLDELETLLYQDRSVYKQGYSPSELRKMLIELEFPKELNQQAVQALTLKVLELAKQGLIQRNLNEERYLEPLFERAQTMMSPARRILNREQEGKTMQQFIEAYGVLK